MTRNIMCRTFMPITRGRSPYTRFRTERFQLPPNKHKLVVAWIEIHHEDLAADWNLAVSGRKPFPIRGLDQ